MAKNLVRIFSDHPETLDGIAVQGLLHLPGTVERLQAAGWTLVEQHPAQIPEITAGHP